MTGVQTCAIPILSVFFPAISAGVYGWDARDVARIGVAAARDVVGPREGPRSGATSVELIRFVLFGEHLLKVFEAELSSPDPLF